MIRMGRSRTEPQEPANSYSQPTQTAPYAAEPAASPSSSRAVTDSEAMARDIKEGRLSGFVGHGTVLSGETNFQAMLRVDGQLVGNVSSETGTLIVGSNGQVDANVSVAAAVVNGVVNGDIIASERVQLGRTARVVGNIQTPRMIIEDGAIFEGMCSMMGARKAIEQQAIESAREIEAEASMYNEPDSIEIGSEETEDDDELVEAAKG
ncbi:MAG: polymer-forming cytoskeletal protein [Acidobacteria bacterium]|nr:polymer-forming cytoskeletal protein [Acidobacteriota bacterium]